MERILQEVQVDANGSLACSTEFARFFFRMGVLVNDTRGYALSLNGKIERPNRSIADGVRAMICNHDGDDVHLCLAAQNFPDAYNLTLHSAINETAFYAWMGKRASIDSLRVWGFDLYPVDHKLKLDDRVKDGKFMGFGGSSRIVQYLDVETQ